MSIFSRLFGNKKKEQPAPSQKEETTPQQAKPAAAPAPVAVAPAPSAADADTVTATAAAAPAPSPKKAVKKVAPQEKGEKPVADKKQDTPAHSAKAVAPDKQEKEQTTADEVAVEADDPIDDASVPDTDITQPITGRFEIKRSRDGRYVFNLFAANKVGIATSQVYSSASSAMIGIKSVIHNAATAPIEDQTVKDYAVLPYPKWELYRDKGNEFRFRLSASNGSCVCHSQGYTSKVNCKKGIDSIIRSSRNAVIDKAYLKKNEKNED